MHGATWTEPRMSHRPDDGMDWESTTWEGSRRAQLEHWAGLSLDEIFAAQEELAEIAEEIARAKTVPPTPPPA
ncbi:MAG: hypothetical protein EDS66_07530 [Planctomycetota bacterium]|nr:MAG: hypothetical protein EDS66_07530 [Planctomycetota bacterium]MCQ3919756.1 hypothetical protein [Planctomycetota bacterium]NUQ09403.1 hypothetical protein [Phycisphaerae bacterium]